MDEFDKKGKDWPDAEDHWYHRVQWLEELAKAAKQCGQMTVTVSLEDFRLIHRRWTP
ncbi:hypothetical protein [Methylorubrum populi]|jgi:hypothetical protein|uniref:hypothetical protein n=1 Tax=Methylorubrum populi TaxID=223967 RepID=UPI0013018A37|nr:hypothetical protein [Methylorubrum populi]